MYRSVLISPVRLARDLLANMSSFDAFLSVLDIHRAQDMAGRGFDTRAFWRSPILSALASLRHTIPGSHALHSTWSPSQPLQ